MYSLAFSLLFVSFVVLTLVLRFWLATRQLRHVAAHRDAVPLEFAEKISLADHQKAAAYTGAKLQFGMLNLVVESAVLIAFTLLGGLQLLASTIVGLTGPGMQYQIALLLSYIFISGLLDLPFDYYRQFVLEQRFGFNKMTVRLWLTDQLKYAALGLALGLPVLWVVLQLMRESGQLWWLYSWLVLIGFQLLMMVIAPTWIMPLFNKFTPLEDASLKQRIEGLLDRAGFVAKGLFIMDGSKRSGHSNAFFSGFGANKRIVFFDTLIARLTPAEMEAVLAHELGHFKLKHIIKMIVTSSVLTLVFLALLGYLKQQTWFYTGLGVDPVHSAGNDAMALILFMLVVPVFTFIFSPLSSIRSRKHEFEADAFAASHTDARDLVSALVKMYEDNASTLTPDPLYSAFYDSHPPASLRIKHLTLAKS
ncbi:MAG: M48 family metallopeptidase [Massilia sp.]